MSAGRYDAALVGGGHNALACAALLARRGLRVVVLERRSELGGMAACHELHPGFRVPTLAHTAGPLRPRLVRELGLAVENVRAEPRVFAPLPDGRALALSGDVEKSAAAIRPFSAKDAGRYPDFSRSLARLARLAGRLLDTTPPDLDALGARDLLGLLGLGVSFRRLGRARAQDLLRWAPMAVADFASEWFESEPLRALVAAPGIKGSFAGPWSAGTTAHLLLQAGADGGEPGGACLLVRGGPEALVAALAGAARRFGAELRTGAEVLAIRVRDGRAQGVALRSGEEIDARCVISGADPQTTLLGLVDAPELDPEDRQALRGYRQQGVVAKVNLALSGLPVFRTKAKPDSSLLSGRIHVGASLSALERAFDDAKYGAFSREPLLEITIPTLHDPGLAPDGRHVMSIQAQYAPRRLAAGSWNERREELGDHVMRSLEAYAPGLTALVLARQVLTPEDIEKEWGVRGGHPLHGEPGLDQIFLLRPVLGMGRYRTPIEGLYLCGAGTHPGGGLTGAPGANAAREILRELKA